MKAMALAVFYFMFVKAEVFLRQTAIDDCEESTTSVN